LIDIPVGQIMSEDVISFGIDPVQIIRIMKPADTNLNISLF
jgi:hypothetical protein